MAMPQHRYTAFYEVEPPPGLEMLQQLAPPPGLAAEPSPFVPPPPGLSTAFVEGGLPSKTLEFQLVRERGASFGSSTSGGSLSDRGDGEQWSCSEVITVWSDVDTSVHLRADAPPFVPLQGTSLDGTTALVSCISLHDLLNPDDPIKVTSGCFPAPASQEVTAAIVDSRRNRPPATSFDPAQILPTGSWIAAARASIPGPSLRRRSARAVLGKAAAARVTPGPSNHRDSHRAPSWASVVKSGSRLP